MTNCEDLPDANGSQGEISAEGAVETEFSEKVESIIAHLRARGQKAERFSLWMMIALVFTTISGLLYYVAFPAWLQYQDSERRAYLAQVSIFDNQLRDMDVRRDEAWGELVGQLDFNAREVPVPSNGAFRSVIKHPTLNEVLAAGYSSGDILRSTDGGENWRLVFESDKPELSRIEDMATSSDGGFVVASGEGLVLVSNDFGLSWRESELPAKESSYSLLIQDNSETVLASGSKGNIFRSDDAGQTWVQTSLDIEHSPRFFVELPKSGVILAPNHVGKLARTEDGGRNWTVQDFEKAFFRAFAVFGDDETVVLVGDDGNVLRSVDLGKTWTSIGLGADIDFFDVTKVPGRDRLIAVGGKVPNWANKGAAALAVSDDQGYSWSVIELNEIEAALFDVFAFSNGSDVIAVGGDLIHMSGTSRGPGALVRSRDGGQSWESRYTPGSLGGMPKGRDVEPPIAFFDQGVSVMIDDSLQSELSKIELPSGLLGDQIAIAAIERISEGAQSHDSIADKIDELKDAISQRDAVMGLKETALADAEAVANGALVSSQEKQDLTSFMSACGNTDSCASAFVELQVRQQPNLWLVLSEKAPQAVLILFLLATFSALYRYNVRLAGFYHSRANALVLFGSSAKQSSDELLKVTEALAADRVSFGRNSSPLEEASTIRKTVLGK